MPLTRGQLVTLTKIRRLDLVRRYKAKVGCVRCGEHNPDCLDFHHPNGDKHRDLRPALPSAGGRRGAGGSGRGWVNLSYEAIVAEIAKCDVICSNCHRKETAQQFPRRVATPVKRSPKLEWAEKQLGLR